MRIVLFVGLLLFPLFVAAENFPKELEQKILEEYKKYPPQKIVPNTAENKCDRYLSQMARISKEIPTASYRQMEFRIWMQATPPDNIALPCAPAVVKEFFNWTDADLKKNTITEWSSGLIEEKKRCLAVGANPIQFPFPDGVTPTYVPQPKYVPPPPPTCKQHDLDAEFFRLYGRWPPDQKKEIEKSRLMRIIFEGDAKKGYLNCRLTLPNRKILENWATEMSGADAVKIRKIIKSIPAAPVPATPPSTVSKPTAPAVEKPITAKKEAVQRQREALVKTEGKQNDGLPLWVWVIGGVVIVLLLGMFVSWKRKGR